MDIANRGWHSFQLAGIESQIFPRLLELAGLLPHLKPFGQHYPLLLLLALIQKRPAIGLGQMYTEFLEQPFEPVHIPY